MARTTAAEPGRPRQPRCSERSRAAGEPLYGTATYATEWLVLEAPAPWEREVGGGEGLPPRARAAVLAWRERGGDGRRRVLFVRRPKRATARRLAFVVVATEDRRAVRRIVLSGFDDLARLDLETAGESHGSSLVLVCGHGSRDGCCASAGAAVFRALEAALGGEELWISSHQGGHRFAANVLVLPAGVQLGRAGPDDARDAVGLALAGAIDLERYRGRTCYPPPVQAAEHAVRSATGLTRLDELRLVGADRRPSNVRFRDATGREHEARVEAALGPPVPASCGARSEPQSRFDARLLGS